MEKLPTAAIAAQTHRSSRHERAGEYRSGNMVTAGLKIAIRPK
jgi:hypothetical protein